MPKSMLQKGFVAIGLFGTFLLIYAEAEFGSRPTPTDLYSIEELDAHGRRISLERYRGKVLLVVNVASNCGYTDSHYRDLVKLQEDLGRSGHFQILAFPCNQFGGQEPKNSVEILHFVTEKYGVNFPVFEKVNVIDSDVSDLWRYLEENSSKVPTWNFWKYLVDSKGDVVSAWGPWTPVEEIYSDIEDAIAVVEKGAYHDRHDL